MHDPMTVAFEIKSPIKRKSKWFPEGYRETLITIWHCDTEKDGTDDSCGWTIRKRHLDKEKLKKIESEFNYYLKNNYWFDKNGKQIFSTAGTLINMYNVAAYFHFNRNRKKSNKFIQKHLHHIMWLAENPFDCIGDSITNKWGSEGKNNEEKYGGLSWIIYADIIQTNRKWYQHPKWHFWHWKIRFNFIRELFKAKPKYKEQTN